MISPGNRLLELMSLEPSPEKAVFSPAVRTSSSALGAIIFDTPNTENELKSIKQVKMVRNDTKYTLFFLDFVFFIIPHSLKM